MLQEMVVLLPLSATVQRSDVQRWEIFWHQGPEHQGPEHQEHQGPEHRVLFTGSSVGGVSSFIAGSGNSFVWV